MSKSSCVRGHHIEEGAPEGLREKEREKEDREGHCGRTEYSNKSYSDHLLHSANRVLNTLHLFTH